MCSSSVKKCKKISQHGNNWQILWKFRKVQIFKNDTNKSEFHSQINSDHISFVSCLLPFSLETFVFQCAMQRRTDWNIYYKNTAFFCWFVSMKLGLSHKQRNRGWGSPRTRCWKDIWVKWKEGTGGWTELQNDEFYNLYSSPDIVRVTKSRTSLAGHIELKR